MTNPTTDTRPREALVEALARAMLPDADWETVCERDKASLRRRVAGQVPVVLGFMAGWLSAHEWACCRDQALTEQWRKEMGDAK